MNIVKMLLLLLAISFSGGGSLQADTFTYTNVHNFSKWISTKDMNALLKNLPEGKYPLAIQGGALAGDGVVYRVLLVDEPSEKFKYKILFESDEKKFNEQNADLSRDGYSLIQHQTVQLMHMVAHQAIWIKSGS